MCPGPRKCEVKLGDFDATVQIETQSRHILGTKNYRSPEVPTYRFCSIMSNTLYVERDMYQLTLKILVIQFIILL